MNVNSTANQWGMTLVEAVVAVSIFALLMTAVFGSVTYLYQQNAYGIEQSAEVNNARRGMTQWNRDVKEMTTAEDGTYPLVIFEPHRLGYYSDTDQDEYVEYVEYELVGTDFLKRTYNPAGNPATYDTSTPDSEETLSIYVQNINQSTSTFFYFDNNGNELTSGDPVLGVRYIQAQVIVNIDPVRNPGEFMLRSSLAPRNLKDNL